MNVIFFGTSDYCLPVLKNINDNFRLVAVVTKRNSGVWEYAQNTRIPFFTPQDKTELLQLKDEILSLAPDLAIVSDYGLIIPQEIFNIPKFKTLNIHFSRLPKLRGPSPVQYTILMGGKSAGISVIIMDEDMDTGDIVWQNEYELAGTETTGSLYNKLFNIMATELPDVINKYVKKELTPRKQNHSQATYTKHFTRDDGYIPPQLLDIAIKGIQPVKNQLSAWKLYNDIFSQPTTYNLQLTTVINRSLRALSPWPELWTEISLSHKNMTNSRDSVNLSSSKKRLKILKAHLEQPATLIPDLVQLEGKKPVNWKQFQEGYPDFSF